MRWHLPRNVSLGFAAAILAIVVGTAVVSEALATRGTQMRAVTRTLEALNSLERLADVVTNAESVQRGYLLTGDPRYLAPLGDAVAAAPGVVARLRERVADDSGQGAAVDVIDALVRRKLGELERAARLRRERGPEALGSIAARGDDLELTDRIRASIAEMESAQRALLQENQAAWSRSVVRTNAVLAGSDVVLLLVVVLAAGLVRGELAEREQRERERARDLELQQQLMGIVGHDLRSPLSAITTSAQLLLRSGDLPERRRGAVERITGSARRMERMIRDLLDFARARAGAGIPLAPRPTDAAAVCRRVVEELRAEYPGRVVECREEGDVSGVWDPDRLEQLVTPLVSNGLRYGAAGAPVRVSARGARDGVEIEVHNDGKPIAPELREHLFEPYRRGGDGGWRSVGLGLFIVRTVAEAHRATIEVRSAEGEGTTFRVHLPRHRDAAPGEARRRAEDPAEAGAQAAPSR